MPREEQLDSHFVPMEDRWRIGFPAWDRYGRGHPTLEDYPYQPGWLAKPIYDWIARNRYRWFGKVCESGACRVHPPAKP